MATIAILVIAGGEAALLAVRASSRSWLTESRQRDMLTQQARAAATDRAFLLAQWALHPGPETRARLDSAQRRYEVALDSLTPLITPGSRQGEALAAARAAQQRWDSRILVPTLRDTAVIDLDVATGELMLFRGRLTDILDLEHAESDRRIARADRTDLLSFFLVLLPLGVLASVLVFLGRRLTAEQETIARQLGELQLLGVARARSESLVSAAFDGPSFLFAFVDIHLRFVQVSEGYAKLTGRSRGEHLGERLDALAPDRYEQALPHLLTVLKSREPVYNIEIKAALPGREPRRLIESYIPVITSSLELIGVGISVVDITDRVDLESRFLQAQKMEAVGRVAGGVAHDFKNLLTVIRSYSELLLAEPGITAASKRELEAINAAAERAGTLARQLLSFSRKSGSHPQATDVNAAVGEAEAMIRRLGDEHVRFVFDYAPDAGQVMADPGELEQVLLNLAVNAIDAMPTGGALTISTDRVPFEELSPRAQGTLARSDHVRIRVTDTGHGMPPDVVARLFEPFFTTKPAGQGTGLGLSTAWSIAAEAKGTIEVRSEVGRGTTFDVYLPSHKAASVAAGSATTVRHTILIIEDEALVRNTLAQVLTRHGFSVLTAANGTDALTVARDCTGTLDLVICDVVMPGVDGIETAERILAERPGICVLLMSGHSADAGVRERIDNIRHPFIAKPFSADEILARVHELLTARGVA